MRVLVCGGRHYANKDRVSKILLKIHGKFNIEVIIQGGAPGADSLAADWAKESGIDLITYAAEWSKYGPSAGPRRNRIMAKEGRPDITVAFPGDKGTRDMISVSKQNNIRTIILKRDKDEQ